MTLFLYPANAFNVLVDLETVNETTGAKEPLTTGTVDAFIATTSAPDAVAAEVDWTAETSHLADGQWLVSIGADALDLTRLEDAFATSPPYLIIEIPGQARGYTKLKYKRDRRAETV